MNRGGGWGSGADLMARRGQSMYEWVYHKLMREGIVVWSLKCCSENSPFMFVLYLVSGPTCLACESRDEVKVCRVEEQLRFKI